MAGLYIIESKLFVVTSEINSISICSLQRTFTLKTR